jgi:hypothetical protein
MAVARIDYGGTLYPAVSIPSTGPVQLDGSLSFDPDKEPLTYVWALNEVPLSSTLPTGTVLDVQGPRPIFNPPMEGFYAIGLWVLDPSGLASPQAEVVIQVGF